MAHAYLPPSAAHTWSKCALWATMNAKFPQEPSGVADEGTAAHWVAWEVLAGRPLPQTTPKGHVITEEMIEGGELLATTIREQTRTGVWQFKVEETLPIPIAPNQFGTPDWWAFDGKRLLIDDYKFGHRFVDEFWNPQGLCYLTGILDALGLTQHAAEQLGVIVSFTVIQPRCFQNSQTVRTHTFKIADARPYLNQLRNMAEAATVAKPIATTNDHCGDCPGRHACPALQEYAYTGVEYSNSRNVVQLSAAAAGLELSILERALARLEARVEGLKEITIAAIRRGEQVPHFRVEQGYGRSQWNVPESQIISIGKLFGADLSKPGTVTPKQAEKLGVDAGVVKQYSFTPSTSLKLIPTNDRDAAKVFGKGI